MLSIPLISTDVYIHNVRSLNKHWEDLIVDPLILQSQVLVLQETMTLSTDRFDILGHISLLELKVMLELLVLVHISTP